MDQKYKDKNGMRASTVGKTRVCGTLRCPLSAFLKIVTPKERELEEGYTGRQFAPVPVYTFLSFIPSLHSYQNELVEP